MKITRFLAQDVEKMVYDKECNTNNHHVDFTYGHVLESFEYRKYNQETWRDKWENIPENEHKAEFIVDLTEKEIRVLREACVIGVLTLRRAKHLQEELEEIERKIPIEPNNVKKYFIRTLQSSPKDGKYNEGPFFTAREMVDALITSTRAHYNFDMYPTFNKLYIVPWDDKWTKQVSSNKNSANNEPIEFRVFYYYGKMTAISQYNITRVYRLAQMTDEELTQLVKCIEIFCNKVCDSMKSINLTNLGHYVIDVMLLPLNNGSVCSNLDAFGKIELVEINTFGAELPAGSALFHWLKDYEQIYGKKEFIEFRITM